MSKNSNVSKISISINKKVFNNYETLVQFIDESLVKDVCENATLKNETIKILDTIKNLLINGQHREIYNDFLQSSLIQTLVVKIKSYINFKDVELIRAMLSLLITITDNSNEICERFSKSELPFILMDLTIKVCHDDFKSRLPKSVTVELIIAQTVLIVHNMARNNSCQQCFIEQDNISDFKTCLHPFLNSKDKRTVILVMAVLTWLAKDDNKDKFFISLHCNIIKCFMEYIIKGMKDKSRWYEGLFVWELLLVLQALSCMDTIEHKYFLTPEFASMIVNILKSKSSRERELEICLGIIWNLSFVENNREKLKADYKMEEAIRSLTLNNNPQIGKKALDYLCYLSKDPDYKPTKKKTKFDIFLSYCHAQNATVKKLVPELQKKFKVWIDTEGIKGNGLDDMAVGIEDSTVLLMAVSPSYKQSQCCRSEANWAYRLKKPIIPLLMERKYKPDGWLGMMMCSETYIDASNIDDLTESLRQIEKHIHHKCEELGMVNITVTISANMATQSQSMKALESAKSEEMKPVIEWNCDDVKQWLRANEMSDLEAEFDTVDGKMLGVIKNMMNRADDNYKTYINGLKLPLLLLVKLESQILELKI